MRSAQVRPPANGPRGRGHSSRIHGGWSVNSRAGQNVALLPAQPSKEAEVMFVRIGNANDVAEGEMRVFDVGGSKVNVTNAGGQLYAFDDTCTHMGCSLAN